MSVVLPVAVKPKSALRRLTDPLIDDLRRFAISPEALQDQAPDFETYCQMRTLVVVRAALLIGVTLMLVLIPTDFLIYSDTATRALVTTARLVLAVLCVAYYAYCRYLNPTRSTPVIVVSSMGISGIVFYVVGMVPEATSPFIYNIVFLPFIAIAFLMPLRLRVLVMGLSSLSALVTYYVPHPHHFLAQDKGIVVIYVVSSVMLSALSGHLLYRLELGNFTQRRQINQHVNELGDLNAKLLQKTHALEDSVARLQQLDRVKSNFLATVSHELRTPLASVIGYSEMLVSGVAGKLSSEQTEFASTILEKGENLHKLISSILDVSQLEARGVQLTLQPTHVAELVHRAGTTVKPLAQRRFIQLDEEVVGTLPIATVDGEKLQQCVVNLLMNAVKFTPPGGYLRVRTSVVEAPEGARIEIAVKDNGIGIDPGEQERIFDSFYQVDSSSTREYGGAGLGLAIVRSYMSAHEGTVRVESELGKGAEFTLSFPVTGPHRS